MNIEARDYDTSKARPPRWVWAERYLAGYLNLITGEEKSGKGVLAAWTIARLTRGELPGDFFGTPVTVGVIADEDGWDDVWVPRLHAAGVSGPGIKKLQRIDGGTIETQVHSPEVADMVKRHNIKLLYVDALDDLLGAADTYHPKQVRDALKPLRALAADLDIAVVGSKHTNMGGDSYRKLMSGSGQFVAASRSNLLLTRHPTGDSDQRVLLIGPGNLSAANEALKFRIANSHFELNGYGFNMPVLKDLCPSEVTLEDVFATNDRAKPSEGRKSGKREVAAFIIREALQDGEWHESAPIRERLSEAKVSETMATHARKDVGVEYEPRGMPARTYWRLRAPDNSPGGPLNGQI